MGGQEGRNEHTRLLWVGVYKEGQHCSSNAGVKKRAKRAVGERSLNALNDKVIVLRRTKLHNFHSSLPSQYDPTSSKNSYREHSFGTVEDLTAY